MAKLLISTVLVTLILKSTDANGVGSRLLETNIRFIVLFAGLMALLPLLSAMRWSLLIRLASGHVGFTNAYRVVMIGNFVGQLLPVIGADAMRVWYAHRLGVSLGPAINSVVLDRVVALGGMLLLVLISLPWLWAIVPAWFFGWIAGLLLATLAGGLMLPALANSLPQSWERWRLVRAGKKLMIASNDLLSHKPSLVYVLGLSLVTHLSIAVLVFGIARMAGVPVELGECFLLIPLVMLVAAIPVSVAGWGVREGAMVIAFGFINVSPGDALLVSVLFGLVVVISSFPGAVFWMTMGRPFGSARVQHVK
ncbi:MAG: flippase-like domain-containing protein [Burkholderiales bacterium]|nr:flippase-like domain-containing protein [Burkholderiales bacterium]